MNPAIVVPQIIRTIPHDPGAFTQGLVFYRGELLESTGLVGQSSLRRIDATNGDILKRVEVPDVFAEGLAMKNEMLIQLTWKDRKAFGYQYPGLQQLFSRPYNGEGWGLTNDSAFLITSNGSDTLYFMNYDFVVKRKLPVFMAGASLTKLNELEYARNRIYANVWYENFIVEINPKNGQVTSRVDCTGLVKQVDMMGSRDALNGIAFDQARDEFYLTGKNWPLVFVVKIGK